MCERQSAGNIDHDFIGREVLDDPILQKNGTSQLSLLTDDAFQAGMGAHQESECNWRRAGRVNHIPSHIALPAVVDIYNSKAQRSEP